MCKLSRAVEEYQRQEKLKEKNRPIVVSGRVVGRSEEFKTFSRGREVYVR